MTSTEIAIPHNGQVAERDVVDGWLAVASDVIKLANVIADTDFVPEAYRDNAPAVAAAILTGRELGIGPLTSLRHVQVVKGVPTLSAEYKRARVLSAGHEFDILELNTQRCKVSGRRRGSNKPPLEITFTMDDARTAGLIRDKGAWKTRPRRMLFARAGSELCDFLFTDVVNGLPTAELVGDGDGEDTFAGYDEPPAQPAQRTTRRRQAPANVPPAVEPLAPPQAPAGGAQLPPLPGEEEAPGPAGGEAAAGPGDEPDDRDYDRDYDSPGTVTKAQLTKLGAVFTGLGFTSGEREQRLVAASEITGRELESSSDLSKNEAKTLIDTLERCDGSRERLIALLAQGDAPEGGQDG